MAEPIPKDPSRVREWFADRKRVLRPRDPAMDLNPMDAVSRKRWANAIAAIMSQMNINLIHLLVAGGEEMFIRTAAPILEGHAFKQEDYRAIFSVLKRTSEVNHKFKSRHVLEELTKR